MRGKDRIASGVRVNAGQMPEDARKTMAKLRAKIAALVKRSAEKREELRRIQARMDRLAAELAEGRAAKGKGKKRGSR